MRLEQLRALAEIVRQDYSVTRAAEALNVPQPAVSRQLRALEHELGVDVFVRKQKRLRGLSPAGAAVMTVARRMLDDAENLAKMSLAEDKVFGDGSALQLANWTGDAKSGFAITLTVRIADRRP